jgi:hypothetical protein
MLSCRFDNLSISLMVVVSSVTLAHNVLAFGSVADLGAQNCQYTTKVDAK